MNVPVSFVFPIIDVVVDDWTEPEGSARPNGRRQSFGGPSGARPARQDKTSVEVLCTSR